MVQREIVCFERGGHQVQHPHKVLSETLLKESRISKDDIRGKETILWPKLNADIVLFIAKCQECQLVKAKHKHPSRLLQPLPIPK